MKYLFPLDLFNPLTDYLRSRGRALVIIPYGNVGDEFIRQGMMHLFSVTGVEYDTIHIRDIASTGVPNIGDYKVLCWGGGGNVSGRYRTGPQVEQASDIARSVGIPFICFPQSIEWFKPHLKRFDKMFLRDVTSVSLCSKEDIDVVLIPDLAMAYPRQNPAPTQNAKASFFRKDIESSQGHVVSDPRTPDMTFEEFLAVAASAEVIETDLFHLTVAALNQGRKVILHDTNWHKTRSMYITWLHHHPITFVRKKHLEPCS